MIIKLMLFWMLNDMKLVYFWRLIDNDKVMVESVS